MNYHVVVVPLNHEEKTELWVKDASNKRLLVEAWGKSFAAQLRQLRPHAVVCLLNFSVKTEGLPSVTLTGEHAGQSERGSALVVVPEDEEVLQRWAAVSVDGGEEISKAWQPSGPTQMSADGRCFTSCLASVRNSSLAFGDEASQAIAWSRPGSQDGDRPKEIWLPDPVRVFVSGVWLTEVRDGDILYTPCSVCKKKIPDGLTACEKTDCGGAPAAEKTVFTAVSLADGTGSLQNVLIRSTELLRFCAFASVHDLETCLQEEGHASLPCRQRADVILGAQKASQYGTATVATFEVLRVLPNLLVPWNTTERPAAPYIYHTAEALAVHGMVVLFFLPSLYIYIYVYVYIYIYINHLCVICMYVRCQAPIGNVMPVASVMEFEPTPAGLRHAASKSMPERVTLVVAAKDKPKPVDLGGAVLVRHGQVVSLCDADEVEFQVEAMCTLADMFAYNMGDGKPRLVIGSLRVSGESRILSVSRTFALEMERAQAIELHREEIAHWQGVPIRRGAKQKADALMTETPLKKMYLGTQ